MWRASLINLTNLTSLIELMCTYLERPCDLLPEDGGSLAVAVRAGAADGAQVPPGALHDVRREDVARIRHVHQLQCPSHPCRMRVP